MAKKKSRNNTIEEKRNMIKRNNSPLTIKMRCELLELPRSSYYYKGRGETSENIMLMEQIDKIHTELITWGSRKIRDY